MTPEKPFISTLLDELNQHPSPRQELLRKISEAVGRTAVAYFTSFMYPVMIDDSDADMIEHVLQATPLDNGLCLVLNSPGGNALAAERIVRICREYSEGNFDVIIARRAKSAATMIAFGAKKIYMGPTSALGPIGTQIFKKEPDGTMNWYSADTIIQSYDELMKKAITTEGHLEPYLQQLSRYDAREIEELRRAENLAVDIAVRWLREGMLPGTGEKRLRQKLSAFLGSRGTMAHGRDIVFDEAKKAGLNVELIRRKEPLWRLVSELYTRADYYVSSTHCKLVESPEHHFAAPCPREG